MAQPGQRTQRCSIIEAKKKLNDAQGFLVAAELAEGDNRNVAVSNAVLSGIASSDAGCCASLNLRSRSADHRDAVQLIRRIPEGEEVSNDLRRLLGLKDDSQYGVKQISATDEKKSLRWARNLLDFAEQVVDQNT